jgi:hypothetical protein
MNTFDMVVLAYIDPGTGSMLLQLLLAGMLTTAHLMFTRLSKVKAFLISLRKPNA